jgi:hypothetical protein
MVETSSWIVELVGGWRDVWYGGTDSVLNNFPLAYVTVFCVFFTYVSMRCNVGCLVPLWLFSESEFYFAYLENPSVEFALHSRLTHFSCK